MVTTPGTGRLSKKRNKPEDLPAAMKDKLREKAAPMTLNLLRFYLSPSSLCVLAGLALLLQSCSESPRPQRASAVPSDSIAFTAKTEVNYAEGFRITYHDDYKLLEILNPFQNVTDTLRYVLKPRGATLQREVKGAQVIELPVRSMIVTSSTHVGLTGMLDANDVVKGVVGPQYIYSAEVRRGIERGEITTFNEGAFNKERALAMDPDLIVISGGASARLGNYQVLMEAGIGVLVNSEWLETTPLGKAEWVKVMAALLNKEALANRRFGQVAERYKELKSQVDSIETRPLVFNNMPFKGDWFVPGGDSFFAQYLKDAAAGYPWFDHESAGGLRLDFEAVYEVGLRADVWLNPGTARTKEQLLAKDTRFGDFKSFKTGKIYNSYKRINATGGNDYWESGVVHPEIVLADLIHIFHPSVLPDHELYYYQRVNGHGYE